MVEQHDLDSIEKQVLALTAAALRAAKERADRETALAAVRDRLALAREALPETEAFAKRKRQERHDAVRGRTELERRLNDLVEVEQTARTRRLQAEQRAESFRAAAAFAASQHAEAARAGDADRAERERMVEARALRECASAESRAAEELIAESKVSRVRADLELHVRAEREVEAGLVAERDAAERRALELRATIDHARGEADAIESEIRHGEAENALVAHKRIQAEGRLTEVRRRARQEVEARIAELRETELHAKREREEHERLLAALTDAQVRSERERAEFERTERERLDHEATERRRIEREAAERALLAATAPEVASETVATNAPFAVDDAHATIEPAALHATASDTAAGATAPAVRADVPEPAPDGARLDDPSRIRTLFSLFGRRRESVEPEPQGGESGTSIADRIARDFGLLGGLAHHDDGDATDVFPGARPATGAG